MATDFLNFIINLLLISWIKIYCNIKMLSLGINLSMHDLDTESHKTLLRMSKEDPSNWRDITTCLHG